MTITASLVQSNLALNCAYGGHLDDAGTPALKTITVGFLPRKVRWLNATDRIEYEWLTGFANGTTLKTAANGVRTLDTGDVAISVASTAGGVAPVTTKPTWAVTIAAAAILQNKVNRFEILE